MKWIRRLVSPREPSAVDQRSHLIKTYHAAYADSKQLMFERLIYMASQTYPHLAEHAENIAAHASNAMTQEPSNEIALANATPATTAAAQQLAEDALTNSPELRRLAAQASYSLANLFLARSFDPVTTTANESDLALAEDCVANAIKIGDFHAFALSTAAQINMTWQRYDRAYELASAAVQLEPTNPEAVRMKGMASYATLRYEEAEQLLSQAWELHPGLDGVQEPLAMLRQEMGK